MNPLTNVKNLQKLNERELELGTAGSKTSWHNQYKDSAWIFVGGMPYDLTEGDIICVFSQYGEIVNINLVRDKTSGKSKGFCFICYEDQRSTILAVDNLNSFKILNRTLRVDHCENYKPPKEHGDEDELTQKIRAEGVAPKLPDSEAEEEIVPVIKKEKKKKKKKEKKKKKKHSSDSLESDSESESDVRYKRLSEPQIKKEKHDAAYYKYANNGKAESQDVFPHIKAKKQKISDVKIKSERSPDGHWQDQRQTQRSHDRDNLDVRSRESQDRNREMQPRFSARGNADIRGRDSRDRSRDHMDQRGQDRHDRSSHEYRDSGRHRDSWRDSRGGSRYLERRHDNKERDMVSRSRGRDREYRH